MVGARGGRGAAREGSRKALRRARRQLKKVHRREHHAGARGGPQPGQFVRAPAHQTNVTAHQTNVTAQNKKPERAPVAQDLAIEERRREKMKEQKLQREMEEQRKKMMLSANEEEEKMIKKLEKQLGIKKGKNKNSLFADDGLDYLLEVCDRNTQEQLVAAKKHLADVDAESDFEEDLAAVTGKNVEKDGKKKNKEIKKKQSLESDIDTDEIGSMDGDMDSSDDDVDSIEEDMDSGNGDVGSMEEDMGSVDGEMLSGDEMSDGSEDLAEINDDANKKHPAKRKDTKLSQQKSKKLKLSTITPKSKREKSNSDSGSDLNSDEDDFNDECDSDDVQAIGNNEKSKEKPDEWEDIYGRKRDKEGNVIKEEKGTYLPPHMRNKDKKADSQELAQLKRHIKGVLNKLAGTNLHWACSTVETLYGNNSRNAVNTALSDLWTEATVQVSATPDRMMAEHAAFISVLQANVGIEVGAHFLQVLVKKFDEMLTERPSESKELENLSTALAYLYSFKIYHASLLYEMLKRLLEDLSEQRVGCMLSILRAVGGTLRKDEPVALKNFIHDTQARVTNLNQNVATGSRIKFLLEILMAVKNNNLAKIPNYDPTYTEHLKKTTKGIIRKGNYVTSLNIGLDDLLKADERGKWWVVGSAWEGNDTRDKKELTVDKTILPNFDQKLVELARKQRMNTDIRRSIFCIIMSAEDYMDAFEKLQHLGLKNQQDREIVHVLLACCLQERTYNPYYAVLAQKLCDYDRKFQLSIQYSVWDKIKDLDNTSKLQVANLAQFLTHLIMEKGLPLSVLKVIEFSDLGKSTLRFMRQILLAIIMNENLQSSLEVFQRISVAPKLHMFRESLRLFIQHFLIRNAGKKTDILSAAEMETLKERTQQFEKVLSMHDSKQRL